MTTIGRGFARMHADQPLLIRVNPRQSAADQLPPAGFEPATLGLGNPSRSSPETKALPSEKLAIHEVGQGAEKAVLASCLAHLNPVSPDLAFLMDRWPGLPEALRAGILAMVKAATPPVGSTD